MQSAIHSPPVQDSPVSSKMPLITSFAGIVMASLAILMSGIGIGLWGSMSGRVRSQEERLSFLQEELVKQAFVNGMHSQGIDLLIENSQQELLDSIGHASSTDELETIKKRGSTFSERLAQYEDTEFSARYQD